MEKIDYKVWPDSIRLSNGDAELVVLTAAGPRIIHYAMTGGPNVFNVIGEPSEAAPDEWIPIGGHRLWVAPEQKPRSYHPDRGPVGSATEDHGELVIANPPESTTGIAKEIRIKLAESGTGVTLTHKITNHNVWGINVAPWALSIVANGGAVVLPQEPFGPHSHNLLPARQLILWKFTDMADPRWRWGTKYITLTQRDDLVHAQKLGVHSKLGWGAHVTPEQMFIVHIEPHDSSTYTDYGSNFETYTAGPFQELETLGPMASLEPGQSAIHVQNWYLESAPNANVADSDSTLDEYLLPAVTRAKAALIA